MINYYFLSSISGCIRGKSGFYCLVGLGANIKELNLLLLLMTHYQQKEENYAKW